MNNLISENTKTKIFIWVSITAVVGVLFYFREPIGNYIHEQSLRLEAEQKWFDEHCKKVGKKKGTISVGVGPTIGRNGEIAIVPVFTPGQDIFQCDDGQMLIK